MTTAVASTERRSARNGYGRLQATVNSGLLDSPPAILSEVPMRRIGLVVVLTASLFATAGGHPATQRKA